MGESETIPPDLRIRARGARSNAAGRYEATETRYDSDGWAQEVGRQALTTHVTDEMARRIITYNRSPDLPFDRSINPYRGCEYGCVYCFARPTHAWLGLSPGLDFETRLVARPNAADVLDAELRHPRYVPRPMAIGTNTDPYQPIEREYRIMRRILEVLRDYRHPVAVVTKGALIERDIDILGQMGRDGLARVGVSITTLDSEVSRRMEPRVPSPVRRMKTIERLAQAGCPVHVMVSPVVPAVTYREMESIHNQAAEAGAIAASWIMLRLPREVSPLFREWVEEYFPDRARRIMGRVRDLHGGQEYDADWGKRMTGEGPFADLIAHRFAIQTRRLGLAASLPPLRTDLFRPPPRSGDQLSLF